MTVCINLLPLDILTRRRAFARRGRWIVACIVAVAAGLAATVAVRASLADPRGLAEELARAQSRRDEAAAELEKARGELRSARQRLDAVGGLADRPNWRILLGVIAGARRDMSQEWHAAAAWSGGAVPRTRAETTVVDVVTLKKAPPSPAVPPPAPGQAPPADEGVFLVTVRGRGESQLDVTALAIRLEQTQLFNSVRQQRVQSVKTDERELMEFEFVCVLGPRADAPGGAR